MKRITACLLIILVLGLAILPAGVGGASSGDAPTSSGIAPTAGRVVTASTALNVRSQPSASSTVVGTIARGSTLTLYDRSGSWWHVGIANGVYGYCAAAYISQVTGSEAKGITATWLNIRSGPSTSYAIQTQLRAGTTVVQLFVSGRFAHILYDGTKTGYASMLYLGSIGGAQSPATPAELSYPAIALSVPSYKQTDSRWSQIVIAGTGRTIGQIGCATTALAMTQSYRTGTVITPDAMAKTLSYTSGGSLYWPSDYAVGDALSLSGLYEKLRQGIPVIVGGRTSSGSTHFVVVTGYKGGNTLVSSGFTINDPGSNTRTTLSAFLGVYPSMYRCVYAK
jgi:uncharacterized protein YgiM (DUF1202 family)